MNLADLKSGLHRFIDQIDSAQLLSDYYLEMNKLIKAKSYGVWDTLTDEQKKEVLLSFDESEDEEMLIDNDAVMARYKNWM